MTCVVILSIYFFIAIKIPFLSLLFMWKHHRSTVYTFRDIEFLFLCDFLSLCIYMCVHVWSHPRRWQNRSNTVTMSKNGKDFLQIFFLWVKFYAVAKWSPVYVKVLQNDIGKRWQSSAFQQTFVPPIPKISVCLSLPSFAIPSPHSSSINVEKLLNC